MARDSIVSLLFRLRADGNPAEQELARLKRAFGRELGQIAGKAFGGGSGAERLTQAHRRLEISAQRVEAAQVRANASTLNAETAYRRAEAAAERFARGQGQAGRGAVDFDRILGRVGGSLRNLGLGLTSLGSSLSLSLTAPLLAAGVAAVRSARDIDSNVNTLKAFIGSAEGAEARLRKLIQTSQGTPGLTTKLAAQLDAQLRVAQVTEETIDRILPAIGRLNAVRPIEDPDRFVQNLVQLVTQNFERLDLKELVGRSPLAGQLITQIFDVDSPINAEAIRTSARRLGINSVDAFFAAFADAARRNEGLANVTESIGTRFDKLADRVLIALRPLGLAIADSLSRAADVAVPLIERLGRAFAALPAPVQTAAVLMGALAAATGPALFVFGQFATGVGGLISAFGRLHALGILPTMAGMRLLGQVMAGTAGLAAGASATAAASAAGWVALTGAVTGVVAVLGLVAYAVYSYASAGKEAANVTAQQVKATRAQTDALREHVWFLDGLRAGVGRTSAEQDKLKAAYAALNTEARVRVGAIGDESRRLVELQAELERVLRLRGEEQRIQAATLGAGLAGAVSQIEEAESRIERLSRRIARLSEARVTLDSLNRAFTRAEAESLGVPDLFGSTRARQLEILERRIRDLVAAQAELRDAADKLNGTAREQSETLAALGATTPEATRQILLSAKAMGLFKGDVDAALASINRFRAGQVSAADETGKATLQLEEQTESLRQLKRALQEAEIAAKSRADAARRAFDEERTSGARFTEEQIANVRALEQAQLEELRAGLEARRAALAGATDDKEKKKLTDEVSELELRRRRIVTESASEIENLRSAQRLRERDEESRHRQSLLAIERTSAETQIDILRAQVERDESLRLTNEQKIVRLEQRITDAEIEEARRRLALASEGTEARLRLQDELDQRLADRARKAAEQRRRIEEAALAASLLPIRRRSESDRTRDVKDEGDIAHVTDTAERGLRSLASVEAQIRDITDESFGRRIARIDEEIKVMNEANRDFAALSEERKRLVQEQANAYEEGRRRIRDAEEEDRERAREHAAALRSSEDRIVGVYVETQRRIVDIARRRIELRRPLNVEERRQQVEHEVALAQEEAALRHAQNEAEIQGEIGRLNRKKELNEREKEQLRALHDELKAETERFNLELEELELRREEGLKEAGTGGFFGRLIDEWRRFKEEIADLTVVDIFAQSLGAAFGNLRENVLGAVDAIVFSGKTLKAALADALKSALAQTAAFLAKKAAMKALEALAEAAMHFAALDFAGGARYLAAAAAWGALAAGVSAAGGAIAGSGKSAAAGLQGGSAAAALHDTAAEEERDRRIREARRGGEPDPLRPQPAHTVTRERIVEIEKRVVLEPPSGWGVRELIKDFRGNGPTRTMLRNDLLGEAGA